MMRAGFLEGRCVAIADMTGRKQPDHNGSRGLSGDDAARTVLDDDAVGRWHAKLGRRVQEYVRMRLASRDLGSAEHSPLEELGHVKNLKTEGEPVRRGGRRD